MRPPFLAYTHIFESVRVFAQRRSPSKAFVERRLRNTRELICLSAPSSPLGACILGGASVQRSGGGGCYCSAAAFLESVNQPTTDGGGGPRRCLRCYFSLPLSVHLFLSTSNFGPRRRKISTTSKPPSPTKLKSRRNSLLASRRKSLLADISCIAAIGKLSNNNNWCSVLH